MRQALRAAMVRDAYLGADASGGESLFLVRQRHAVCELVPSRTTVVFLVARPGIEQHQRFRAGRMREMKCQRHEAAERQACDDGAADAASVEHSGHIVNGCFMRVERRIVGRVGAVVAAHVPCDQMVAVRQRVQLTLPHARAGAVSLWLKKTRARAPRLVVVGYTTYAA